jgi:hypothetical protein
MCGRLALHRCETNEADFHRQGTTIQLVCFLAAEFPVQFLTKRYGFKRVLPTVCTISDYRRTVTDEKPFLAHVLLGSGL